MFFPHLLGIDGRVSVRMNCPLQSRINREKGSGVGESLPLGYCRHHYSIASRSHYLIDNLVSIPLATKDIWEMKGKRPTHLFPCMLCLIPQVTCSYVFFIASGVRSVSSCDPCSLLFFLCSRVVLWLAQKVPQAHAWVLTA